MFVGETMRMNYLRSGGFGMRASTYLMNSIEFDVLLCLLCNRCSGVCMSMCLWMGWQPHLAVCVLPVVRSSCLLVSLQSGRTCLAHHCGFLPHGSWVLYLCTCPQQHQWVQSGLSPELGPPCQRCVVLCCAVCCVVLGWVGLC